MMRRIPSDKIIRFIFCCTGFVLFITAHAEHTKNTPPRTVIIKGNRACPPYEFINDHGHPDGFNVDLTRELMKELDIPYTLSLDYWPRVMTDLQQRKADIVMGMICSNRRAQTFKFGPIHAFVYLNAVFRKGETPVTELDELNGRRIIVQANSIAREILAENAPQAHPIEVDDLNEGLRLLSDGSCDIVICAQETARDIISKQGLSNLDRTILDLPPEEYCFVGNNDTLIADIDRTFHKLKRNGTYDRIYNKWFSGSSGKGFIPRWIYIAFAALVSISAVFYVFIRLLRVKVRRASREIKRENYKLSLAIKDANTVFWEYDAVTGFFRSYNEPLNDYNEKRLLTVADYQGYMDGDDLATLKRYTALMQEGRDESYSINVRVKTRYDTEWRHCTITGTPFEKDPQTGRIVKYVGFRRDNTQIVKLHKEVNDYVQKLRYVLYHSRILVWNYNIAARTFEFDDGDDDGRVEKMSVEEYLRTRVPLSRHKIARLFIDRMTEGREEDFSFQLELLPDANGNSQVRYAMINGTPIRDASGEIIAYSGLRRDITDLILTQQRLMHETERALQADKLKSAFLANMSHEIRTPLNAIVGFSSLLQTAEDPDERAEYINIIVQNNELLLRLIGDILDLAKMESGTMELKPERFDLAELFEDIYASLKLRCTNPDVKFLKYNPYCSCIVELDKDRLVQLGTNFVTNAIKYTSHGHILMSYEYIDSGIRIYVEDTGIGISQDKQQLVFERFEKLDVFVQGSGLGLAICQAIVDACGGKIGVESEEGKGSTFWAWIPCEAEIVGRDKVSSAI